MSIHEMTGYRAAMKDGIALDEARLCTVCWTIHQHEECPVCSARQWHMLVNVLRGVATGLEMDETETDKADEAGLRLVHG